MIVEFNCPKCGKTLQAADQYSGKRVQCRSCKAVLIVPGLPPIQEAADGNGEPDEAPEPSAEHLFARRRAERDAPASSEAEDDTSPAADPSYGIASLYLAAFSFVLFFTPALLGGLTGALGASVAFFAGIFVSSGCFLCCRHGYRLAQKAEELPGGQGYAAAGKFVNAFLIKFYVLGIGFFIVGAVVALFFVKHATNQLQDTIKGVQGVEKMFGQ